MILRKKLCKCLGPSYIITRFAADVQVPCRAVGHLGYPPSSVWVRILACQLQSSLVWQGEQLLGSELERFLLYRHVEEAVMEARASRKLWVLEG